MCGAIPLFPQVFMAWKGTRLSVPSARFFTSAIFKFTYSCVVWNFGVFETDSFRRGGGVRRLSAPFSWPHFFLDWPNFSGECFKILLSLQKVLSAPYNTLGVIPSWLSSLCPANTATWNSVFKQPKSLPFVSQFFIHNHGLHRTVGHKPSVELCRSKCLQQIIHT